MGLSALMTAALLAGPYTFTITPAATGRQVVRVALPLPRGWVTAGQTLHVTARQPTSPAVLRPITWYPGPTPSVRRGLLTFPYDFASRAAVTFTAHPAPAAPRPFAGPQVTIEAGQVRLHWADLDLTATVLAPARSAAGPPTVETVEDSAAYRWQRFTFADPVWPRVVEVRADAWGEVVLIAHLQNLTPGFGRAPDFGWTVTGAVAATPLSHGFGTGEPAEFLLADGRYRLTHPAAPLKRRGGIDAQVVDGRLNYVYEVCRAAEKVPHQEASWRRAELVIAPTSRAPLTPALQSPHTLAVPWERWHELYATGQPLDLTHQPVLAKVVDYHLEAMDQMALVGDDWGNVTGFNGLRQPAPVFGMNRLNHGRSMFEEGWRSGHSRLVEAAVTWCDNFYDQSLWWGATEPGGTRYNNIIAQNQQPPDNDRSYMWRSNSSVSFCTKGFDCFWLAWEQTGDPRFRVACEAQVAYTEQHVHAGLNYTRNIGLVDDFLHLYAYTGDERYRRDALKLFGDLRPLLSPESLFAESGKPLDPSPPFIYDDSVGYAHPYAKPYIIGYALSGLPDLARLQPAEPRLNEVVRAVADFLVQSQDPLGGWRYPHPRSAYLYLSQAIEHAWQLVQAARRLGPEPRYLDAIERVLRQRLHGWLATDSILSAVGGWEFKAGQAQANADLARLYAHPEDRDAARDTTTGEFTWGGAAPESVVYLPEVLAYYLAHRPAQRLLAPPAADEPLGQLLARVPALRRPQ